MLGGDSRILDWGRATRLFDGPTRQALVLRDQGCVFPGCSAPAVVCEGHHIRPWWDGGRTDLGNAVLLCPHHHRIVEPRPTDTGNQWQVRIAADGVPEFLPPRFVDKNRTLRRHQRFLLHPSPDSREFANQKYRAARKAETEQAERERTDHAAQFHQKWLEECLAGKNPWHPPESFQKSLAIPGRAPEHDPRVRPSEQSSTQG